MSNTRIVDKPSPEIFKLPASFPKNKEAIVVFNSDPSPPFYELLKQQSEGKIFIKFSSGDIESLFLSNEFISRLDSELEFFHKTGKLRNFYIYISYEYLPIEQLNKYKDIFQYFSIPSGYAWYNERLLWPTFSIDERTIKKHFTCLLNRPSWYRQSLFYFMHAKNIKDKCFLSYNMDGRYGESKRWLFDHHHEYFDFSKDLNLEEIFNMLPYKNFVEAPLTYGDWSYGKEEFVTESLCNIINETYNDPVPFFTEKTFKCFQSKQMFLLYGGPGSLKYLNDLGFQTFGDIFNEDYDTVENPILRFEKMIEEIDRISKFSLSECQQILHKAKPILEHNYNHFRYSLPKMFEKDMENITIQVNNIVNSIKEKLI